MRVGVILKSLMFLDHDIVEEIIESKESTQLQAIALQQKIATQLSNKGKIT